MSSQLVIAVLGAAGSAGSAIVRAGSAAGHKMIAVTRSGHCGGSSELDAVDYRAADLADPVATRRAVAGAHVVVFAANIPYPRWGRELPVLIDHAVDAAGSVGARFVLVDNLYMYAPALTPITEAAPEHATDQKGVLRRSIGEKLLGRHQRGEVEVVIVRASDFFGPLATNSLLYLGGIKPGWAGKTMRGLFDIDQPHSFAYLPDIAQALIAVSENPSGDGHAWVLPATVTATQREMLEQVNRYLPAPVAIGTLSAWVMRSIGLLSPLLRSAYSVKPQFDRPWVVDGSAAVAQYGLANPTDLEIAIKMTVASFASVRS
ncbi:MAG: hypothetical protein CSA55_03020 [Ilumatobacter coccineus]|uniref:NAD-dependent epimerase/dehydratase domain-containing protein n=1 Tax=Ilumatobacter coccineus TaxID=467094 RepID=A0A2G6KAJ8_9ACTN|nr:MAG: hypothetical protein CSA55_03020 [Ilumatobacter coccineus]